ncbi:NAD(P)-dependent oxidoreductase [archaeon]|jgi:nucleoside-diphosphate-sugar epimerase|nr:NAD(P)-dependent oxidoreductase [archaeon]MBT6956616.1 NAD(P)-dependent oxidoreductase [archaeon]MBT7128664.1 NAD(P)-dependent oxidoreductase [archaeon]
MKIFVTGSRGYLGKSLVDKIGGDNRIIEYDVTNGDDILDYERLSNSMKTCDIVVHAAAIPKPDNTKTFDDYFSNNCIGTLNVVNACVENRVKKLIYISSTAYYGAEVGIPVRLPLRENNKIFPMYLKVDDIECGDGSLAYPESKIIAENILAFYGLAKKIPITILRFPRIADEDGPYGTRVSMNNAIQGIEKSIRSRDIFWYETFNIADELDSIDISKAKEMLGYEPA